MTVLSLDLGNSALKAGIVGADDVVARPLRLPYDTPDVPQRLAAWLMTLPTVDAVVLGSVVPARTEGVLETVQEALGRNATVVHPGSRWPFTIGYASPESVGVDRLAAVCGALDDASSEPLVVVDAGTAVTIEAVTARRTYLGGAIGPGPQLSAAALGRGTAQLPAIDVGRKMPEAIGRSTHDALRSGTLGLFVHGVGGLVEATCAALNPSDPASVKVVTTGGWAPLLAAQHPRLADVQPHLVLVGLARLASRETGPA